MGGFLHTKLFLQTQHVLKKHEEQISTLEDHDDSDVDGDGDM